MTAFASATGTCQGYGWTWDLRSVNGKGLDLRLRVPDWIDGLEAAIRARLGSAMTRGNVNLSLRVQSEDRTGQLTLNTATLEDILSAMAQVEARAMETGVTLAPATAADLLALRGVLDTTSAVQDTTGLRDALLQDLEPVLNSFLKMRQGEGAALAAVLSDQLEQIAALTDQAAQAANARQARMADTLRRQLARVTDHNDAVAPERVAQELAVIAVKSDVTEELDRLRAHIIAAHALLEQGGPVGRKLDFLTQEFNREANTLCSKAQDSGLSAVGLELKAVIDQMREQVQNVE
ncbi:YicC family protein [Roseovarius gahaiensis]|uniref:YicC family protein n=2 Tax=Roseovarius gahaiensis TaxID=2716691 RepID=A0A967EF53_9RHOB|nr:YicC/YloC family endoribonuclease [Roseovarius gahaiensis]NHQ74988.1 YicC family protein [Roseovarius gahaiensis]